MLEIIIYFIVYQIMGTLGIIFSGIVVFLLGQILQEFFLKPLVEYNKEKGKIIQSIIFYSSKIFNKIDDKDRLNELNTHFRKLTSSFLSAYYSIPLKKFFVKGKIIVSGYDIETITKTLIGISNVAGRLGGQEYSDYMDLVKELEKILKAKLI